jgi:anti-sigma B factor antagonist
VVVQMPEAGFPVEMAGGVPVVAAPGEIDVTSADDLRTALVAAAARGHGTFVVDMSLTRFCDSSGLHALVAAHRRAQAEGGEMLLVVPGAAVLRILAITGVDQVIPNFASLGEALAQAPAAPPGHARAADTLFPFSSPEATHAHAPLPDHYLRPARPGRQGGIREL